MPNTSYASFVFTYVYIVLIDELMDTICRLFEGKICMQMQTINGPEMLRGIYIENKPVPEVANELHYSRQGAYKLRDRALRELDRILAAEEQADRQQSVVAV